MTVPPHVVIFYDEVTLAPRIVVVNEDGEDGALLIKGNDAPPGMLKTFVPKSEVRGKSFHEMASYAIMKKHGRAPPSLDEIHAADKTARGGR